jgi:hypothetical protein
MIVLFVSWRRRSTLWPPRGDRAQKTSRVIVRTSSVRSVIACPIVATRLWLPRTCSRNCCHISPTSIMSRNVPTHTKRCAFTSPPQRNFPQRSASKRSKNEGIDSRTQQNSFLHVLPIRAHIFAIELDSNDRECCTPLTEGHMVRCRKTYQ